MAGRAAGPGKDPRSSRRLHDDASLPNPRSGARMERAVRVRARGVDPRPGLVSRAADNPIDLRQVVHEDREQMKTEERTRLIIGEPEHCVAKLKELAASGVNHVILHGSPSACLTRRPSSARAAVRRGGDAKAPRPRAGIDPGRGFGLDLALVPADAKPPPREFRSPATQSAAARSSNPLASASGHRSTAPRSHPRSNLRTGARRTGS